VADIARWTLLVLRHRPALAHYPVTSYWNFEKSLLLLLIARMLGARSLGHLHGGFVKDHWDAVSPLRRLLGRWLMLRVHGLVVLSSTWKDWVVASTGLPPERVHVVSNPIDPAFEDEVLDLPAGGPAEVLYLGALARSKGVFDLVQAAARLRDEGVILRMHLAGPERGAGVQERLSRMIRDLNLTEVTLHQPVSGAAKSALVRRCGILVLPSYRENFPLTVLEGAAAGRALIATPVGATPEFFRNEESALLVPPGDIGGLAAALRRTASSAELRTRLGEAARGVFRARLAREHSMRALDAAYRSVLGEDPVR
jgi:glycosyltransferase involved in cell wall biosynthesis